MNSSNFGYEALDLRRVTPRWMCTSPFARILNGHLSVLRHMHLVWLCSPSSSGLLQGAQVTDKLDLDRDQTYRVGDVGRKSELPGPASREIRDSALIFLDIFRWAERVLTKSVASKINLNRYSQFWTKLLCLLFFPSEMASLIAITSSLCGLFGTISLSCGLYLIYIR